MTGTKNKDSMDLSLLVPEKELDKSRVHYWL